MTIAEGNIVLVASQVMEDVDEGGGRATGTAITDGTSNAIFPDISELDRTYGRINLRKVFPSVQTNTNPPEGYFGANVIVADAPDDENVSCTLFSTEDHFDRRIDAQSAVEAYVVSGPLSRMRLYGDQQVGQRAIACYQRTEQSLPEVGQVFCLSVEAVQGVVTATQFVRVTEVEHEVAVFTDNSGDFERRIITLHITDPLRQVFLGAEPVRTSADPAITKVRSTQVADATLYFGIVPLADDAFVGDLGCKVDSIYSQLVPSSQTQTPISLAQISSAEIMEPCAVATASDTITFTSNTTSRTAHAQRGILPGTLSVWSGATQLYSDNGNGTLNAESGGVTDSTVDYAAGTAILLGAYGTATRLDYTPAVEVVSASHTRQIVITLATRGTVYSETLDPIPAPFTLRVSFLALGKWYELADNGDGALVGDDPSIGTGSVNYATGSVLLTLGALPDVDSSVILTWGSPVHYTTRSAGTSDASATISQTFTLPDLPVGEGSVVIVHYRGGSPQTSTESAGVVSGGGITGTINYTTGVVILNYGANVPDAGTSIGVAYNQLVPSTASPTLVSGTLPAAGSMALGAAFTAGSLQLVLSYHDGNVIAKDDGAGALVVAAGQIVRPTTTPHNVITTGNTIGTVNYTTGVITISADLAVSTPITNLVYDPGSIYNTGAYFSEWTVGGVTYPIDVGETVGYTYRTSAANTPTAKTTSFDDVAAPLVVDLTMTTSDTVIPNSVRFTYSGKTYIDRNGLLYADVSGITGSGTTAGDVDYDTGVVRVNYWDRVASPGFIVETCLTRFGLFTTAAADFRTGGSPLRPASLYVQATAADGPTLTATSNNSGVITGAKARGVVNQTTGVVFIEWGEMVVAAGNEAEWWYDAARIVSGNIWRPREVMAETIRYNAVVISSLPLDADILGIDPVRLPSDGRVPIFRPGNVAVVHHTANTTPGTVSNSDVVDVGRTRLARVRVIGNNGATITAGYTVDLDAGTVTFTNVSGYSQPVHVEHRIEDMALVSDAQISGDLTFTRVLSHDFPTDTSYVSSALIIGDMKARVSIFFDQGTWANVWADALSGSAATGTFNDTTYPFVVSNAGAITERWAMVFTSSTLYNIIGEHVGQIVTGASTGVNQTPTNPATAAPYFSLNYNGWGSGWAAGNVLRFNTLGALAPVWIARTIQQGPSTDPDDSFTIAIRGDIDRP